MRPISEDLRHRVIKRLSGGSGCREVARHFECCNFFKHCNYAHD